LETEKVLWERNLEAGVDRACITPDGKKLYAPTGWWWRRHQTADCSSLIHRTATSSTGCRPVPKRTTSIASLDGRFVYLGTETNFWVYRTKKPIPWSRISTESVKAVFFPSLSTAKIASPTSPGKARRLRSP
jgi:hypothetical protein